LRRREEQRILEGPQFQWMRRAHEVHNHDGLWGLSPFGRPFGRSSGVGEPARWTTGKQKRKGEGITIEK
jgi:hypothetical protein